MSDNLDNIFKQIREAYINNLKPSEVVELGVMITSSGIFRTAEQLGKDRAMETCRTLSSMYRDTYITLAFANNNNNNNNKDKQM